MSESPNKAHVACRQYHDCDSPLCPLDPDSLEYGIWYPDEEIYRAAQFRNLHWIKVQRRITRVRHRADSYFTVKMLEAVGQVRSGIKGTDPNQQLHNARAAEKCWIMGRAKIPLFGEKSRGAIVEKKGLSVLADNNVSPQRYGQLPRTTRAPQRPVATQGMLLPTERSKQPFVRLVAPKLDPTILGILPRLYRGPGHRHEILAGCTSL